jgi:hypothetical protein
MRPLARSRVAALCGACVLLLWGSPPAAAADFELKGVVLFTNVQNGLDLGEDVPYYGVGVSDLIGPNAQTGSIRPTSPPVFDPTTFQITFTGEVGPHPLLPFGPRVHIITTGEGLIFCTWTAKFTIQLVSETEGVFSGDGAFTVIGGTGKYAKATGTFRTLFATDPIPLTSDSAVADVTEQGTINRK